MTKIYFLLIVTSSLALSAQHVASSLSIMKFKTDSLNLDFNYFNVNKMTYDFSKLDTPFSLYHPMAGLNIFKFNSMYYYSMDNTNQLVRIAMKGYDKKPLFPDVKTTTLGEAIFIQVMNSLFDK